VSAAASAAAAPPAKGGKKKLILIIAIVLLLVVAGGGAALFFKNKAAKAAAEGEDETPAAEATAHKVDAKHPPTFLPLDPFVVNLADRDADRYAQIGITLEVEGPEFAEQMKAYMPAVRNAILLILSRKTAGDLLAPEGKEALAQEIARESVRPMGIDIDPPGVKKAAKHADEAEDDTEDAKPKKKKKKKEVENPVKHVNFSNFIIQ
jgi:flagellar FliL protein